MKICEGILKVGELVLSFITFVCFAASKATYYFTAPLIEFFFCLYILIVNCTGIQCILNDWTKMDITRCFSASILYLTISIIAVSKYEDKASTAAGAFGFIATIVFTVEFFYLICNNVCESLEMVVDI